MSAVRTKLLQKGLNYGLLNSSAKCIYRQRWPILAVALIIILIVIVTRSTQHSSPRDTYHDDVSPEIYNYVVQKWFNQSGAEDWYNHENIDMFDPRLLHILLEHWIIKEINKTINFPYLGFRESKEEDPSMGQAKAIRDYFNNKTNGFFIECGAYDGETRSNTWVLEKQLNWTGILIEADPINFTKMLNKNRRAYLSPTCLSIKPHPTNVSFLMARNIGRIHEPHEHRLPNLTNTLDRAHEGTHVGVQCFPLASYIAALKIKTVDYFSLDIEGHELDVLKTIPFDKVDITTLSVEFTHVEGGQQRLMEFMQTKGYFVYSLVTNKDNLANDVIFVKKSQ
ncbi:uncharacterized protein [Fopius arisanus]|uniref:Uncharacterized protein isoform X1 n=1 Tax=Fopius arisanus TaxID=64838 RepID=A0A9R1TDD7_9HYME|nr:PREDICTED: uncharacterized protein LOC105269198 isoform X1 [Fopius arisanus]XP_011307562.1 PREDICTED: uncharacterized protein LOC105269198 isoform X1 [Fopius arisanus]XP_011307563.1 PREDICTED: uncharacterized protein LOC105269198 isoform X1 [Fopius arisanus]